MATCEVCGDGFADDAEKHLCSPSRDSCSHVCHADWLQQYRLKQGCPMHDCPFCLQNEDSQEEADDAALQEMEIEAAMEAEAVAEGVKRKTREEAASPVRAGGGPAAQEVSNQRKPASRTTQPSAAHPKVPKPRKPSLHTGWKWSSPLVHSKLWDWHLRRPESDQQGIYHGEGSYARRHVGVLGLQGWSTKPFVASHQEHISRAWKPRGFLSNRSECSLERPQGPPRCGIRLCLQNSRSAARAFRSQLENHCPQGRLWAWDIHGADPQQHWLDGASMQARGFDCSLMRSTDVAA